MEKFGIFELLDALTAFAAPAPEPADSPLPTDEQPAPPAPQPPPTVTGSDAYAMLLARQEKISRRIDKENS